MAAKINDLTSGRHSISECNEHIIIFNGLDRPRYYNIPLDASGYLGISDWSGYQYKPVAGTPVTGGSLSSSAYYSIIVVPVNANITAAGSIISGNATSPSAPVQTGFANYKIPFTIPVHPQFRTIVASSASSSNVGVVNDNTQTWTVNQWAGYTVKNVETGVTDTVASNTSQALTLTAGTMVVTNADRYQILSSEVTARYIYAASDAVEASVLGNTFYLVGIVTDNTTTSYDLTTFVQGEIFIGDNYAPPNAFTCHTAGELVWCGGGITVQAVGTAAYNGADEVVAGSVTTSIIDDVYVGSGGYQIVRYAVSSAFTDIYIGSRVTVTLAGTAGNNIANAEVLRVASDNTWFEILNNDASATTETMTVTMTPNIIEGTSTTFSEGMVDARFEFTNDDVGSYVIAWVDVVNQRLGLTEAYAGNNATTTAFYRIRSDYNLYYSDYKNPHKFRSISLIEIGDDIKGMYALGRNLMIFCSGSLWRVNMLEPGGAPQLISDSIFFDSTWSICSNGSFIVFFDGEGFSATDGTSVRSLTALKSRDYLSNINKLYTDQIQGVYNAVDRRFEFSFPMGIETLNNYGLYVTEDSYNNVPFSRVDMNALFTGYDDGDLVVFHGTSGELSGGVGDVWTHKGVTDGLTGTEAYSLITAVSGQDVTVLAANAITWGVGDVVTFYPATEGTYQQLIIESLVDNGGNEYVLTFADDYDVSAFAVNDNILYGLIPFDYGVKWTDFGSPQNKKRMKELQFDLFGLTGKLFVDHYVNLSDTSVQSDEYTVAPTKSKIVVPFRMGKCYSYGFRVRGFSSTEFKINTFIRIFGVIT